jgi:glycosyltransferase involved in cell wall biosynthesis
MPEVSIIIPARNEVFLKRTADDLLDKGGDIEVIAVMDGYWPHEDDFPRDDPRLVILHHSTPKGMRASINHAAAVARGKYLMKCDAHCLFDEGYDKVLKEDCADNWIMIPRRYSLAAEVERDEQDNIIYPVTVTQYERAPKECIDYTYYFYPFLHPNDLGLHARPWWEFGRDKKDILIDENISWQGSCWFMHREHFFDRIGGMSEYGYEHFMGEPQEIGFKTQLGPWEGKIMRNKRTWYAHLHKGRKWGRMYFMSKGQRTRGNAYSWDFWWYNRWEDRIHDIEWLIERFMPMPKWPEDWRELKENERNGGATA